MATSTQSNGDRLKNTIHCLYLQLTVICNLTRFYCYLKQCKSITTINTYERTNSNVKSSVQPEIDIEIEQSKMEREGNVYTSSMNVTIFFPLCTRYNRAYNYFLFVSIKMTKCHFQQQAIKIHRQRRSSFWMHYLKNRRP